MFLKAIGEEIYLGNVANLKFKLYPIFLVFFRCCSCFPSRMCRGVHFIQTSVHVLQVFISYLLMLVFMTYNVYLCASVLLGTGIGYFIFRWNSHDAVDTDDEHCN